MSAIREARAARAIQRAAEREDCEEDVGFMFDTAHAKDISTFRFERTTGEDITVELSMIKGEPGHVQSGQYLWPAARASVQWLIDHEKELDLARDSTSTNKTESISIVELGAGCGLTSLGACQLCPQRVRSVALTDHDYGSVQLLERNAEALYERELLFGSSFVRPSREETILQKEERSARTFHVEKLEWGQIKAISAELRDRIVSADRVLLLGSDLLYSVDVVVPLLTTAAYMLCEASTSIAGSALHPAIFILTSSFDVGEDINEAVSAGARDLQLEISEMQHLDLSVSQCRVQYIRRYNQ